MTNPGNRRIDHILSEAYLDDLAGRPLDQVRQMRADAEQEETDLSYLRRLLQGRMDILRAELARRVGDDSKTLVESLTAILTQDPPAAGPHGLGRHVTLEPTRSEEHRRHVESMLDDVDLSDPAQHDDADLGRVLDVLEREEASISDKRRAVQHVMDTCTAEMARRYQNGSADAADLLPSETS